MVETIVRDCWCGAARAEAIGRFDLPFSHDLVRCEGCGVLGLWPQPNDQELEASYYSREYYGHSRQKFVGPIAAFIGYFQHARARLIQRRVPRGSRILDVGCGNGGFLRSLVPRGYQGEATEWTSFSAARVGVDPPFVVHVGDLLDLDLPDERYDAVTLWHVFEHLRRPDATLERIHRLLKPEGRLFLSMPNAESWQAQHFGIHWLHHDPPRHMFEFGPRSLAILAKLHGFRIDRLTTVSLEQNLFGYIQSWLNARGYPRDLAYDILKRVARVSPTTRMKQLSLVTLLVLPGLVETIISDCARRGATMTVELVKA